MTNWKVNDMLCRLLYNECTVEMLLYLMVFVLSQCHRRSKILATMLLLMHLYLNLEFLLQNMFGCANSTKDTFTYSATSHINISAQRKATFFGSLR
jgi:hypothetical protein